MDIHEIMRNWSENKHYYGHETTTEVREWAEKNGYVIVFGASDDLAEFMGAIYDEVGCFEGGRVFEQNGYYIDAVWHDEGISWTYNTNIPHFAFPVYDHDDDSIYCIGIVFNIKDCEVSA